MVLKKRDIEEPKEEPKEEPPKEEPKSLPALEEAKEINKVKKELLDREEALQKRKEDFEAERIIGGRADAGGEHEHLTPKDKQDKQAEDEAKEIVDAFR